MAKAVFWAVTDKRLNGKDWPMNPKQKKLFDFLCTKLAGDVVTEEEILTKTGWALTTLNTYRSKHHIDPFLAPGGNGIYQVLRNGDEISEHDVVRAFTQVKDGIFTILSGMKFEGSHGLYELKAKLGNGAVAHVWRCSSSTGEQLAAKVMCPNQDLLDPKFINNVRQRFIREARNGIKLSHPNIVRYLDYGELDEHPFIIMELADCSLGSVLKTGSLPFSDTLEVMLCCLSGLKYLHGQNCTHRDIKPDNILKFGTKYVLGDMGIVRWSDMNPKFTSAGTLTRDSIRLGSWHYMSPEQRATPHQVTEASDIYALGISWYEMLTQQTPDPANVAAKHFPPATTNTAAEKLIRQMVAFNPTERPSVSVLLEEVERIRMASLPPGQLV